MLLAALLLAGALSPFEQVVAQERAFAAASLERGLHEAFLANLAEDSVVFAPAPVPGRAAHQGKPPAKRSLSWGPAWVAVSSAGDLALSTGPWESRLLADPGSAPATGYFFSVWRREPDGAFRVAIDAGVTCALTFALPTSVENGLGAAAAKPAGPGAAGNAQAAIAGAERAFTAAAKAGIGAAAAAQGAHRMRVYRDGKPVAVGPAAARALLAADTRKAACAADRVVASASGDLGYAYGACLDVSSDAASKYGFLHVWRKLPDGAWRLLVDVTP